MLTPPPAPSWGRTRGCQRLPQDHSQGRTRGCQCLPQDGEGPGDVDSSPRATPEGGPGDANTSPSSIPGKDQGMPMPPPGPFPGEDWGMPAPPPGLSPGGEPGDADASPRTLPGEGPGDANTSPRVRGPGPSSSASPTMRLPVHPAPVAVLVPECGGRSQGQYGALRPRLGLWPSRPVDLPLHPPSGTFTRLLCSPVLLQPHVIWNAGKINKPSQGEDPPPTQCYCHVRPSPWPKATP